MKEVINKNKEKLNDCDFIVLISRCIKDKMLFKLKAKKQSKIIEKEKLKQAEKLEEKKKKQKLADYFMRKKGYVGSLVSSDGRELKHVGLADRQTVIVNASLKDIEKEMFATNDYHYRKYYHEFNKLWNMSKPTHNHINYELINSVDVVKSVNAPEEMIDGLSKYDIECTFLKSFFEREVIRLYYQITWTKDLDFNQLALLRAQFIDAYKTSLAWKAYIEDDVITFKYVINSYEEQPHIEKLGNRYYRTNDLYNKDAKIAELHKLRNIYDYMKDQPDWPSLIYKP